MRLHKTTMLLVPNLSPKDWRLMLDNLRWQKELDGKVAFDCLLAYDESVEKPVVDQAKEIASSLYRKVSLFPYPTPEARGWPAAPNYVWQSCARFIAHFAKKLGNQEWLFLEADAIPISQGWLGKLAKMYQESGKPFLGHPVRGMGHFNGVAVYPAYVAKYVQTPLLMTNVAWDVVLGQELRDHNMFEKWVADGSTLINHVWAIDPNGEPTNDSACPQVTFKSERDVWKYVNLDGSLFHRNKDGTLIKWLRTLKEWKDHPELRNVPVHAPSPAAETVEVIAPQPMPAPAAAPPQQVQASPTYEGRAEILICTYWKDSAWLDYSLRAMRKFLTGFSGITIVIPRQNCEQLRSICQPYDVNLQLFDEMPGKGMLDHMVQICSADRWCPRANMVVHLDPDCIFHAPTTVDEYVREGKPVMLKRTYSGLLTDDGKGQRVVSDCYQWKKHVEAMLGFETDTYTMCRHPSVHPVKIYPEFRQWIEAQHKVPFRDYMLAGRNEFPQDRNEFPALGAFAWEFFKEDYHWIDIDRVPPPKDMQKTYWSHGGITEAVRHEIEGFLNG